MNVLLQFAQTRILKRTYTTTHKKELFSIQRKFVAQMFLMIWIWINVGHKIVHFDESDYVII